MNSNGQDKDFEITEDNISRVRVSAENKHRSAEEKSEDIFYNDVNRQSKRIENLVEKIGEFPDPAVQSLLAECMEAVLTLHGKGLERILNVIVSTDGGIEQLKKNLLDDSFISGMLLIHGLHPEDLETRLYRALDKVKPYMDSHGGSVQVVSLKDGVAKLKLEGSCDGCPSSASTLELGIKEAIEEECPDLLGLEVEGVADNPLANEIRKINMEGKNTDASKGKTGYKAVNGLENLSEGEKRIVEVAGQSLLFCSTNGNLYAYHNECAGCGMPLNNSTLEDGKLSCKLGHKFDVQKAGVCPDDSNIHLTPFPLIKENGIVKVAVG